MEIALLATAVCLGIPLLMAGLVVFSERFQPSFPKRRIHEDTFAAAARMTFVLWALLTAVGLYFALTTDFFPTIGSDKGQEISDAFRILTALAVPVFAMVIAVLIYTLMRRSTADAPSQDGPAIEGTGFWPNLWLGVSAGLTLLVIVYPGLTTLEKVVKTDSHPDLVVNIEGVQWTWLVGYPDQGLSNQRDLVLPVDRTVNFTITSRDVLHSFWVPSLFMKSDAVPGQTTTLSVRLTKTGEYDSDPLVRLQCTELCGLGHSSMRIPVRVVSQSEFDSWVREKRSQAKQ